MDSLSELLQTAGTVDIAKLILLIGFVFAVTVLYMVRNAGKDKERDDSFRKTLLDIQRDSDAKFTRSIDELKNEFKRLIDMLIENQKQNHAVQIRSAEMQERYIEETRADRQYREGLARQLSSDMADNKLAIETNTAEIQEGRKMTEDGFREVTNRLDRIDQSVVRIEEYLGLIQAGETSVSTTVEHLCADVHEVRDLLNRVIKAIEEDKTRQQTETKDKE